MADERLKTEGLPLPSSVSALAARRRAEFDREVEGWTDSMGWGLASTARLFGIDVGPTARRGAVEDRADSPRPIIPRVVLLPRDQRRQLGLIATSIVTPTVDRLSRLFPEYEWEATVGEFAGQGLLKVEEGSVVVDGVAHDVVRVTDDVSATITGDEAEMRELLEAWAAAYEVRRDHSDIGYLLGLTYVQLGRLEDGVAAMVDVADALEPGHDHGVYVSIFDQIAELGGARKLSPELRVRFYNAHGLCLSRIGRYEEALGQFKRLRRLAKRIADTWAIGQSYLHVGVVYAETGKPRRARAEYQKAIAHGRKHGDLTLLSRVLHNLAVLTAHDASEAHRFLNESLRLKEAEEDWMGLVHVHLTRGLVYALAEERSEARRAYGRAVRLARRHDLRHLLVISLQELAVIAVEDGRTTDAVTALREANEIAEREGYERLERQTRGRLAGALAAGGKLVEAAELFERVYDAERESGTPEGAMEALYNWAVTVLHLGDAPAARQLLGRALRRARSLDDISWVGQVRLASAFSVNGGEPSAEGIRRLHAYARDEARQGENAVSAWLLDRRSRALVTLDASPTEVEEGFRDAEAAHRAVDDTASLIGLYASWFVWRRETMGLTPEGIEASAEPLRRMQAAAEASGDIVALAQAVDEEAVGFQHLGRYAEAEPLHRRSLRLSERASDARGEVVSLTNLGELCRKTDRTEEALAFYDRAIRVALSEGDGDAELALLHNRALALEALGRVGEAEQALRGTRRRARRLKAWGDQSRATIALGNLAWGTGDRQAAIRHYRRAFEMAQRHGETVASLKAALAWGHALDGRRGAEAARERIRGLADNETVSALDPHQRFSVYRVLAGLAEAVGDLDDAAAMWSEAAAVAPDRDSGALAWGALGDVRRERGDGAAADEAFRQAFDREDDPDGRAALLYDRFRSLALVDDEVALESVFDEARSFMEEHELHLRLVDLHMAAGDHNWESGESESAVQLYIAAIMYGVGLSEAGEWDDEERSAPFVEIPFHLFDRLMEIASGKWPELGGPPEAIEFLRMATESWLREAVGDEAATITRILLWPFRAAARFAAQPHLRRDQRAIERVLAEETQAALRLEDTS